jgi:hypothetical protein
MSIAIAVGMGMGMTVAGLRGFILDSLVDFLTVNTDFAGRLNPQTDLIPLNAKNRYVHIVSDDHSFTNSPGQDQHRCLLPPVLVIVFFLAGLPSRNLFMQLQSP